jgi:hypothetical protein
VYPAVAHFTATSKRTCLFVIARLGTDPGDFLPFSQTIKVCIGEKYSLQPTVQDELLDAPASMVFVMSGQRELFVPETSAQRS